MKKLSAWVREEVTIMKRVDIEVKDDADIDDNEVQNALIDKAMKDLPDYDKADWLLESSNGLTFSLIAP